MTRVDDAPSRPSRPTQPNDGPLATPSTVRRRAHATPRGAHASVDRRHRPLTARDAVVAAVIALLGVGCWLPFAVHADFLLDDFRKVDHFELGTPFLSYRPVFRFTTWVAFELFGTTPAGYYVTLSVVAGATGALLYLLLRRYGLPAPVAACAGLGVMVYPRADSSYLWWADSAGIALLLGLGALLLGAVWVDRAGLALRWLVPSLVLLAAGVCCYEAVFPIVLLPASFLTLSAARRRRWSYVVIAGATSLAAAAYIFDQSASVQTSLPFGEWPGHAFKVLTGAWRAFVAHGFNVPTGAGIVTVLVAAAALALALGLGPSHTAPGPTDDLVRLAVLPALLAVCALVALVPLIPANEYYEPTLLTFGNRVNVLASVFVVTAVVTALWWGVELLRHRGFGVAAAAVAGAVVFALLAGFAGQVRKDQFDYTLASTDRRTVLANVLAAEPHPPQHSVLLFGDYQADIGPVTDRWFPVILNQRDATPAAWLLYRTPTLAAAPLNEPATCRRRSVSLPAYGLTVPYARVVVIDVDRDRAIRLGGPGRCAAVLAASKTLTS